MKSVLFAALLIASTAAVAAPPPPLIAVNSTMFRSDVEACLAQRLRAFGTPAIVRIDTASRVEFGGPVPYLWFDIRESGLTRLIEARSAGPMYDRFEADVRPCM